LRHDGRRGDFLRGKGFFVGGGNMRRWFSIWVRNFGGGEGGLLLGRRFDDDAVFSEITSGRVGYFENNKTESQIVSSI
jgi:hypothetical protein